MLTVKGHLPGVRAEEYHRDAARIKEEDGEDTSCRAPGSVALAAASRTANSGNSCSPSGRGSVVRTPGRDYTLFICYFLFKNIYMYIYIYIYLFIFIYTYI